MIVRGDDGDDQARGSRRASGRTRRGRRYAHGVSWRDLYCGELRTDHVGRRITVAGWVDTPPRPRRPRLRRPARPHRQAPARHQPGALGRRCRTAHEIRNEFVLQAEGEVVARAPETRSTRTCRPARSRSRSTRSDPLALDAAAVPARRGERRRDAAPPLPLARHAPRADAAQPPARAHSDRRRSARTMDELGFVDVWTPSMTRGTPEGARDFLVPVRLQPGKFFALAQSPQIFKQLCMVGGIDRYYQIATCWRDEDLRADRQFEFRQLDLEMAFAEREDVLDVMEAAVVGAFEAVGREPPSRPFPRISYDEAMPRYGSDKPDLRFGLEIQDATEVTRGSEFGVFANAAAVRYLVVAEGVLARGARAARGAREGVGGEGARLPRRRRERRGALADREVPLRRPSSQRSLRRPGRRRSSSPDERRAVVRVLGLPAPASRARARPDRPDAATSSTGCSTSRSSSRTRTRAAGRSCTTRSPRRSPGAEVLGRGRSRRGCAASTTTSSGTAGSSARARSGSTTSTLQATRLQDDRAERGGGAVEVRLPARRARDGRAAARRLRDGHRAFRRPARGRAGHPRR